MERLEEGDAEAELIGGHAGTLTAVLLRRHVRRCAGDAAAHRARSPTATASASDTRRGLVGPQRQPEVEDPDAAVPPHHHVARLEVTVHEPGRVGSREPAPRLHEDRNDLRGGARALGEPVAQRDAVDVLHGHEDRAVDLPDVVHRDDVRVGQARDRLGLAEQAPLRRRRPPRRAFRPLGPVRPFRPVRPREAEELQGDATIELGIVCRVDDAHAASAEQTEDHVALDRAAGCERGRAAGGRLGRPGGELRLTGGAERSRSAPDRGDQLLTRGAGVQVRVRLDVRAGREPPGEERADRIVAWAGHGRMVASRFVPPSSLSRLFLDGTSATGAPPGEVLESLLGALLSRAQEAWPDVTVPPSRFLPYLAARLPREAPIDDSLAAMFVGDLYLACGCAHGDPTALSRFERSFLRDVAPAVAHLGGGRAFEDEVAQLVRQRVLLGGEGAPPRIAEYTGRGNLRGWLRVVAVREGLQVLRRHKREEPLGDRQLEVLAAAAPDPELAHLERTYAGAFRAAFQRALAELEPRERNLLRQHYLQDLSIDEVGGLYGVHRATAARWIARARGRMLDGTRAALGAALGLPEHELDSLLRLIQSKLDVSLRSELSLVPDPEPA